MNGAHLHLIVNHIPVIALPIGVILLLVAYLLRDERWIAIGYLFIVIVGLLSISVYLTGSPAAGVIHNLPDFNRSLVHDHAEFGETTFTLCEILAGICLIALVIRKLRFRWLPPVIVLAGFIISGMFIYTANLGGKIRHPEVRSDFSAPGTRAPVGDPILKPPPAQVPNPIPTSAPRATPSK